MSSIHNRSCDFCEHTAAFLCDWCGGLACVDCNTKQNGEDRCPDCTDPDDVPARIVSEEDGEP